MLNKVVVAVLVVGCDPTEQGQTPYDPHAPCDIGVDPQCEKECEPLISEGPSFIPGTQVGGQCEAAASNGDVITCGFRWRTNDGDFVGCCESLRFFECVEGQ